MIYLKEDVENVDINLVLNSFSTLFMLFLIRSLAQKIRKGIIRLVFQVR